MFPTQSVMKRRRVILYMQIIKAKILFTICLFVSIASSGQGTTKCDSCKPIPEECRKRLQQYQDYWLRDSIGEYGFRDCFSTAVMSQYSFIGVQWEALKSYLGKPNDVYQLT